MSLPRQTPLNEIIRKFRALGWDGPFNKKDKRKGSSDHRFMGKGKQKVKIPSPHGQKPIGMALLKNILYQAGISVEEWMKA
jgi:predicted RNA binding protein YcfA (HicA-like mRNA interferase family)